MVTGFLIPVAITTSRSWKHGGSKRARNPEKRRVDNPASVICREAEVGATQQPVDPLDDLTRVPASKGLSLW